MNDTFMKEKPIFPLLTSMALPMVVSMLVNALYNIVDSLFVARISEEAMTALSLVYPVQNLINAIAIGFSIGIAALISLHLGAGNKEKADMAATHGMVLSLIHGVVISIVCTAIMPRFLRSFTSDETVIAMGVTYSRVAFMFAVVIMAAMSFEKIFQAVGRMNITMIGLMGGSVCNIILDPIFIFGFGMGVKGAALATIISQAVSCGWVLAFLTGKKTFLRIKKEYLKPVPSIVFPCLALGLSTFVMQSSESVISVCFNSSLLKYGGDLAVGAMTILTSTMQFAMLPLQGIGQGAQPIMSYNYGARNIDRMKKTFKLHLVISLIYSTLFWLFVQLFPATFAGIFSSDPELVSFTAGALRIYCGAMFLFGIQLACQMTFVAIGYAVCSIIVAVVRKFVLLLPLIFIVPMFVSNKTMGVYMAEPSADAIAVTFTAIIFAIQFRKALRLIEGTKKAAA